MSKNDFEKLKKELEKNLKNNDKIIYLDEYRSKKYNRRYNI